MKIRIIAVGSKMPGWVETGWDDYAKRLGSDLPVELIEVPVAKRSNNSNTLSLMEKEAQGIQAAIKPGDRMVALDVLGKSLSTEQMASQLAHWQQDGRNTALIIGGPDGIHPDLLKKAEHKWS
ncbi:MAG TPA: 23S rRNA (pseudouridine(1915)-N(3))-methyltransferase RlmH, partial [Pseudomonadales bacterium]|nr:23S rRNA (pseudouridine(1915)-N(3))-methyltransferase RlmH [Pseudomonadales bacterium]